MRLPIDTDQVKVLTSGPVEPRTDFDSGEQKTSRKGEPIWSVPVVLLGLGRDAHVASIRVAGEEPSVDVGTELETEGLAVLYWEFEDRHGHTFVAQALRPKV